MPALAPLLLAADVYAEPQSTVRDPQALVREVVMNELRAQQDDQTHRMYVSREGSRETDQTEEVIETRLRRALAHNRRERFHSNDISFIFFVLPPSESATNDEFVMLKKDACQPSER